MHDSGDVRSQLRQRAVRLLARREHTRAELLTKLAAHGPQDDIVAVIDDLTARGLQSDARFAGSYLRAQGERLGAARLRQTLRRKGVDDDTVQQALGSADLGDDAARARALWQRKFGTAPADARDWARQARFLQSRGFSGEIIHRLLRQPKEADE